MSERDNNESWLGNKTNPYLVDFQDRDFLFLKFSIYGIIRLPTEDASFLSLLFSQLKLTATGNCLRGAVGENTLDAGH